MRSAISALAGFALAGSFAVAQPSDGRLKIIHDTDASGILQRYRGSTNSVLQNALFGELQTERLLTADRFTPVQQGTGRERRDPEAPSQSL